MLGAIGGAFSGRKGQSSRSCVTPTNSPQFLYVEVEGLLPTKEEVTAAILSASKDLGRAPSRAEFKAQTGMTEYQILQHFKSWTDAVESAGLEPDRARVRIEDDALLEDWARVVREQRHIPTREYYRKQGKFSPGVFEKHFGPWTSIPKAFRNFAASRPELTDVLALLPSEKQQTATSTELENGTYRRTDSHDAKRYTSLPDRATYGNPIDFRGLRHEPVNENGVVFLFGTVARELGYLVEAVQSGFPDCEAKRQVGPGRWQRVRIEFEFESRNFRDHGHKVDGCDVIVCWRHNWEECPESLEVVELLSVLRNLAGSEE